MLVMRLVSVAAYLPSPCVLTINQKILSGMRHSEELTTTQSQALISRFNSILHEGYFNEILMTMNVIQQQMLEWERIEGINIHAAMYNHSIYEILSLLEVAFLEEKS